MCKCVCACGTYRRHLLKNVRAGRKIIKQKSPDAWCGACVCVFVCCVWLHQSSLVFGRKKRNGTIFQRFACSTLYSVASNDKCFCYALCITQLVYHHSYTHTHMIYTFLRYDTLQSSQNPFPINHSFIFYLIE